MVQREIAERLRAAPGGRDLRLAQRRRPARLRGRAGADRRPGGVQAAAAGRVGDPAPAPPRAGGRPGDPRAGPRRLRAPAQVAGPLARARPARQPGAGAGGAGRARPARGRPRRGALARAVRRPVREACRPTPEPMLVHAPAKLNLCLYLGRRRADGLHELCSLFEPLALADLLDRHRRPSATRSSAPGSRARTWRRGRWRRCARRAGQRPPLRIEIEKRVPVAAGLGGGSGDAAAVLRLAAGEVAELPAIAARLGADVPSQLRPSPALVRGFGERVEPLPAPPSHAAVLLPDGGGLRTADVFAEADRLGLGRSDEELAELATRLREVAGARRLAARLPGAAGQRPRGAGALAAAGDRRGAGGAARGRRPAGAAQRLRARPRSGSFPTSPPPARPAPRSAARTRSSARRAGSDEAARRGRGRGRAPQTAADRRRRARRRRRLLLDQPASSAASTCRRCWKKSPTRSAPGPTCWSASSPSPRPAPSSASSSPARR